MIPKVHSTTETYDRNNVVISLKSFVKFHSVRYKQHANIRLTKDKIYRVHKINGASLKVVNDKGVNKFYASSFFEKATTLEAIKGRIL